MTPKRRRFLAPKGPMVLLLMAGALLVVSFQNFSNIPLRHLKLQNLKPELPQARAIRRMPANSDDIRDWAPSRPESTEQPMLATPDTGGDLDSISRSWFSKQTQLLTGGADQRLVASVNKQIDRWMRFEPVEGESWPEPGDSENGNAPASDDESTASPGLPPMPAGVEDMFSMRPTALRLTALNRFQVQFAGHGQLNCAVNGNHLQLDLNQPITDRFGFDIRHDSGPHASTVHLNYNW